MLIEHLKKTFAERSRNNPAYSLRAFSRSIGMDSSTMSALLSGKRPLTLKTAKKIVDGLGIKNPAEAQALLVETLMSEKNEVETSYSEMAIEVAEAISSWEHFAILALLELKDFRAVDRAISERLNIPISITWECLARLEKLGLVRKGPQGWVLTGQNMATPTGIPSGALREGHRQSIQKALASLEADPVDMRDISGITMAISKKRLPAARKMIQEFRRTLATFLEEGKRDAVYQLNVQLFPLSKEKQP